MFRVTNMANMAHLWACYGYLWFKQIHGSAD